LVAPPLRIEPPNESSLAAWRQPGGSLAAWRPGNGLAAWRQPGGSLAAWRPGGLATA